MTRQIQKYVVLALASIFLSGCVNREVKQTMLEVEAIIDERPAEALSIISEIDSIALTGRLPPRQPGRETEGVDVSGNRAV